MSKYTITRDNLDFGPPRPVEIELTEQEVRELASQLPTKVMWKLFEDSQVEDMKEPAKEVIDYMNKISPGTTTAQMQNAFSDAHNDDDMSQKSENCDTSKVSDCCGAEIQPVWPDLRNIQGLTCKSCGEPCEAVEEKTVQDLHHSFHSPCPFGNDNCPKCTDTKPDPIEPVDIKSRNLAETAETAHEHHVNSAIFSIANKVDKIIKRLNSLSQYE